MAAGTELSADQLFSVLSGEPATWLGVGQQNGQWTWDLTNAQLTPYAEVKTVDDYLVRLDVLVAVPSSPLFCISGEQGGGLTTPLSGAGAWLLLGTAFVAGFSVAAALWYVVVSAGIALLIAVGWGLAQLVRLVYEEHPWPGGLSGVGLAVLCLAGAVVSAATGHRWVALGGAHRRHVADFCGGGVLPRVG